MSRFLTCLTFVFDKEGGFVNDPDDRGGPTNMGVTLETLRRWRHNPAITEADVRAMHRSEARAIYEDWYWSKPGIDQLPIGVDLLTFDFGVNSGPGRAIEFLQRAIGVEDDGVIGPQTLGAAASCDRVQIIDRVCDARLAWLRTLPTWWKYGKGWTARVNGLRARCKADVVADVVMDPGVVGTGAAATAGAAAAAAATDGNLWVVAAVVAGVLILGAGVAWFIRRRRK